MQNLYATVPCCSFKYVKIRVLYIKVFSIVYFLLFCVSESGESIL